MKTVTILIWLIVIVCWAFYDKDRKLPWVDHVLRFWLRGATGFFVSFIWFDFNPVESDLLEWCKLMFFFGATFWLLFDALKNVLEGKDWNYVGETAWFDRYFHRYENPSRVQVTLKLILLVVSIVLLV